MFWLQAGIWDGFGNHFQTVVGIYLAGAVCVGFCLFMLVTGLGLDAGQSGLVLTLFLEQEDLPSLINPQQDLDW